MGFDFGNIVDNVVTALVGGGTGWFLEGVAAMQPQPLQKVMQF